MVILAVGTMAWIQYGNSKSLFTTARKTLDRKIVANHALLLKERVKRLESELDNYSKLYCEKFKILYSEPDFKGYFERLLTSFSTVGFVSERGELPIIVGKQIVEHTLDLSKTSLFKKATEKPNVVQFELQTIKDQLFLVLLVYRKSFFDEFNGGYIAYISFDQIAEQLELKGLEEQSLLAIFDSATNVLYNVENRKPMELSASQLAVMQACEADESKCAFDDNIAGNNFHIEVKPDSDTGLAMLYAVPDSLLTSQLNKSLLYAAGSALLLIGLTYFLNLFVTRKLLVNLGILTNATEKIGQGDFSTPIQVESTDEIGLLANSFRHMLSSLDEVTKQKEESERSKVRLEKEVEIAQHIQKYFFPEEKKDYHDVDVASFSMSATECRGDWLYHFKLGAKYYVMIGDATGHGIGPALITSAVRGTISIVEMIGSRGPAEILRLLNHAVYQSAKGEILMTFFIACLDSETGRLQYANASHEFPFVIQHSESAPNKMHRLDQISGYPLGQREDTTFKEFEVQLSQDDLLVMYTDGVGNLKNSKGRYLNDKALTTLFSTKTTAKINPANLIEIIRESLTDYHQPEETVDDAAILLMKVKSSHPVSKLA